MKIVLAILTSLFALAAQACKPVVSAAGLDAEKIAGRAGDDLSKAGPCDCQDFCQPILLAASDFPVPRGGPGLPVPGRAGALPRLPQGMPQPSLPGAAQPAEPAQRAIPQSLEAMHPDALKLDVDAARRENYVAGMLGLKSYKGTGMSLPAYPDCPIDARAVQVIRASPLAKLAASRTDGGAGLVFLVQFYLPSGSKFPTAIERSRQSMRMIGETLASQFVTSILKSLYPRAEFLDYLWNYNKLFPGRQRVDILIRDNAEHTFTDDLDQNVDSLLAASEAAHTVQMALIKPVSFRSAGLRRLDARLLLHVRQDARAFHIYSDEESDPRSRELLGLLVRERTPDVVFFSPTYLWFGHQTDFLETLENQLALMLPKGWQVARLSTLTLSKLLEGHWVVINDRRGVMPYLNAAVNHMFVLGAVTPMESLLVGTPTTIVRSPKGSPKYNANVYRDAILRTALGTGGAAVVDDVTKAAATSLALERSIAGKVITPPYLVKDKFNNTALDRFLGHLMRVLTLQGVSKS